MKNSIRGALWSALIFPGSGQIVLNHRKRGLTFALISITGVVTAIITVVRGTWAGLEQQALLGADISLSAMGIVAVDSLSAAKNFVLPPMFLCWLLSVIDAWRLGREP